jgi:hypothetical protein
VKHYHGTPITPDEVAIRVLRGRHAFISFADSRSLGIVQEFCQSFARDNGAFTMWRQGITVDWQDYFKWVDGIKNWPAFDWAVIPDVIEGSEDENDQLIDDWPFPGQGVPVWHFHESLDRLRRLSTGFQRVALGSSGAFDKPNTTQWWMRMNQAMSAVCDDQGYPITKLHGLRMLNPEIFRYVPLSSADSTNVVQNKGVAWRGQYEPKTPATKAVVIAERIELAPVCTRWAKKEQMMLFE